MITFLIFTIFIPLVFSALLSATETAITAASPAIMHKWQSDGNKRAELVLKLREDNETVIATILLANNAFNIFASSMATWMAIRLFGGEGVIYATIIMTCVIIIFAEVLPKTYAIANANKFALFIAPSLNFVVNLLRPITNFAQIFVNIILKLFKANLDNQRSCTEELRGAIDLHHKEGVVRKDDRDMLDSILDLSETVVSEVMVHRKQIFAVSADDPTEESISKILESDHTRVPIWKDSPDNIIAVVHTRDLLKAIGLLNGELENFKIIDIASEPWFVPETAKLRVQLQEFQKNRKHFAIVVDEYGDIQGILTLYDILEEIVGRIDEDEEDDSEKISVQEDGTCLIGGAVTVRDFNRILDWDLPDGEASTIAGLIIHGAERLPEQGEEFEFYGVKFKIIKKVHNQIVQIFLEKIRKK